MPDPNPPFDQYTSNRFNYPYTLRDNLTNRRADHNWRAVYLEKRVLEVLRFARYWRTPLYVQSTKISGQSDVLRESFYQESEYRIPRGMGGLRYRVNFSGLPQLGQHVSGQFLPSYKTQTVALR